MNQNQLILCRLCNETFFSNHFEQHKNGLNHRQLFWYDEAIKKNIEILLEDRLRVGGSTLKGLGDLVRGFLDFREGYELLELPLKSPRLIRSTRVYRSVRVRPKEANGEHNRD